MCANIHSCVRVVLKKFEIILIEWWFFDLKEYDKTEGRESSEKREG